MSQSDLMCGGFCRLVEFYEMKILDQKSCTACSGPSGLSCSLKAEMSAYLGNGGEVRIV